jgi:hypothetical protein
MTDTKMTFLLEQRIYKGYKLALKSSYGAHRAASRRQYARETVVKRYNVSYADVKSIVERFDAAHNISHPHDPDYLLRRKLEVAQEEYTANPVPCSCGSTDHVRPRWQPFALTQRKYEIYTVCLSCDITHRGVAGLRP